MLLITDDRRTFTGKDKVRRIQTLGNDNKDAMMLNCESGFHQSEDKRKLNCHKLRSSFVTSILITKLTFANFSLCFINFFAYMRRNTSKEVNRSFSLLFFFSVFVIRR